MEPTEEYVTTEDGARLFVVTPFTSVNAGQTGAAPG